MADYPDPPSSRSECPIERPCPCLDCRYRTDLTGECALDLADEGPMDLEAIATHFGVTRQAIAHTERIALIKYRRRLEILRDFDTRHHG